MLLLLRTVLLVLGGMGVLDTMLVSGVSSLNMGVLLPGIMGMPLLLTGLFLPVLGGFFASAAGHIVKWILLIGYGALCVLFIVVGLLLHADAERKAPPNADVLIVLGAGLRGETPTLVLRNRLDTAIAYLEENPHTVAILSGGKGKGEHISEAEGMARYFAQKGISASRYIKEDASASTRENFLFSARILRERFGADASVVFVTTDFHVFRARRVARKMGLDAHGIAAPDVWYISPNNHLRESLAVVVYALTGEI